MEGTSAWLLRIKLRPWCAPFTLSKHSPWVVTLSCGVTLIRARGVGSSGTPPLCTQPSCTISIAGPFLHFFCSSSWEHNSSNLKLLHSKILKMLCFKAYNRFLISLRVVCCICIAGTCTVMVLCGSLLLYLVVNADETGRCWVFF